MKKIIKIAVKKTRVFKITYTSICSDISIPVSIFGDVNETYTLLLSGENITEENMSEISGKYYETIGKPVKKSVVIADDKPWVNTDDSISYDWNQTQNAIEFLSEKFPDYEFKLMDKHEFDANNGK